MKLKNKLFIISSKKWLMTDYSILISNELSSDMSNEEIYFTDELEEHEYDWFWIYNKRIS